MKRLPGLLIGLALGLPSLQAAEVPTFNKEIAPILWKHCAGCHRQGEVGPFPLLTYKEAEKRAEFIAEVTSSRTMPPWKPEPNFGDFHDEHRLSEEEIKLLADWAEADAPEGDPKDLPKPPVCPEGWQLGEPDMVLKVPDTFEIPADGPDIYRCFVIPIPTDTNKTVAAVEFRPGNRRVVHHAILFLDANGAAREKDAADPGPGFASFGGPGFVPTGALGGWAPGAMPRMLPDGTGRFLRGKSDLVLQIHYHPDGKAETDQSVVGLYFTKKPAKQIVVGVAVRSRDLNIPAGAARHHVAAQSSPLPVDAEAIGIVPHMHYIGKEMKVVAESPDGKTTPLLWIKDWDFNWQGQYLYKSPVKLAKGTVIKLDAYYDNSAENPRNPSKPPKPVHWGEQTTDEMCLLGVQVVTSSLPDLFKIVRMNGNRIGTALVGGAPTLPGDGNAAKSPKGDGYFTIPPDFKDRLAPFDVDKDGRLSPAEIRKLPARAQERIRNAIESGLN